MNILVLTSVYPEPDDSNTYCATATVKYYAESWAKLGHRVIVVHCSSVYPKVIYKLPLPVKKAIEKKMHCQIPSIESCSALFRKENGVKIYRVCLKKIIPHGNFTEKEISNQIRFIKKTIFQDSGFIPDAIIGHWANPQIRIIYNLKKDNPSIKTSIVFHNDCSEKDVKRYKLLKYCKGVDAFGCRKQTYGEEIKANLNLNKNPFFCPSGVPDEIIKKIAINEVIKTKKENSFVYIGRLVKYKRVDTIIKAISLLDRSVFFSLHIIGTGNEENNLRKLSEAFSLEERVKFDCAISRIEVFNEFAKAECFIMVSENETFGMTYIEAMLMGCITIASKGSAMERIIHDGINGFLCEAGNEQELFSIIAKIMKMELDSKKKIMIAAHNTALEYADSRIADKYLKDVFEW